MNYLCFRSIENKVSSDCSPTPRRLPRVNKEGSVFGNDPGLVVPVVYGMGSGALFLIPCRGRSGLKGSVVGSVLGRVED